MKPRILLSATQKPNTEYVEAVRAAGGEPHIFYAPKLDLSYDALLLCGGSDVDPIRYGEENTASVGIDSVRDEAEFALFKAYYEAGKPILGICRGHQLINVAMGGSLIQHVDTVKIHRSDTSGVYIEHGAYASDNGFIGKMYGEKFLVNSCHHQAVKIPAPELIPVAWSDTEDLVEALEHPSRPLISVQWHPEKTCLNLKKDGVSDGLEIFKYFIDLCKNS
jgi:putative glutamine amidotransferase